MNVNNDKTEKPLDSPPEQLELYREALLWLFRWTLLAVAIISVSLIATTGFGPFELPILALVVMAGALGALFSSLTRLYSLRQLPAALIFADPNRPKKNFMLVFCLVPPIVGMIGAAFFYAVMLSEIVTSNIFVDFQCSKGEGNCGGVKGLLLYSPGTPADFAKAIVWGFVAGFSERLVPDTLARLENEVK